jgi:hypothetical protein
MRNVRESPSNNNNIFLQRELLIHYFLQDESIKIHIFFFNPHSIQFNPHNEGLPHNPNNLPKQPPQANGDVNPDSAPSMEKPQGQAQGADSKGVEGAESKGADTKGADSKGADTKPGEEKPEEKPAEERNTVG